MKNKIAILYALIVGIVFLVSGIGKSLALADFANSIAQYGLGALEFLAPLIVVAEVTLGLLLVLQIRTKEISLVANILLVGFTLAYLYGYWFHNVTDCGCFGAFDALNMPPLAIFIRNAILIYLLLAVWRNSNGAAKQNISWQAMVVFTVLCIVSFASGYTYSGAGKVRLNAKPTRFQGQPISGSLLGKFVSTAKDSTYLVFAFSYTCPHCYNSIENLKQYETSGVVDRVVALALENSANEEKFRAIFHPNFSIKNCSRDTLLQLTNHFPTAYYIKNDTVKLEWEGALPCSYLLQQMVEK
ncbi:hypothetical protein AGMMS4956_10950 [Bacteroidia bacterium]|nr:hypothetical protein AGMMS4956_10950 [Bacteroidia bacterium]